MKNKYKIRQFLRSGKLFCGNLPVMPQQKQCDRDREYGAGSGRNQRGIGGCRVVVGMCHVNLRGPWCWGGVGVFGVGCLGLDVAGQA